MPVLETCRRLIATLSLLVAMPAAAALPPAGETLAAMQRAADWQLRQRDDNPRGWVQATFWLGLTALADRSSDSRYTDTLLALGAAQRWQLGPRVYHADDHLIGAIWLWAFRRRGDAAMIAPLRARAAAILAAPSRVSLDFTDDESCQQRWCWCDALFMAPATWAALARITGDARMLAFVDDEFGATKALLFDAEQGLFLRDSRFLATGRRIYWSRGNGWVFAGLARLLDELPADHVTRAQYEALFQTMAAKLLRLQRRDGTWPASLLAADAASASPETSGTALFVYGLAWGVRAGLLDREATLPAIEAGWAALLRAQLLDGRIGWVQRIGDAPGRVAAGDTQPFGVGAFLLAGGQVADLATESR